MFTKSTALHTHIGRVLSGDLCQFRDVKAYEAFVLANDPQASSGLRSRRSLPGLPCMKSGSMPSMKHSRWEAASVKIPPIIFVGSYRPISAKVAPNSPPMLQRLFNGISDPIVRNYYCRLSANFTGARRVGETPLSLFFFWYSSEIYP